MNPEFKSMYERVVGGTAEQQEEAKKTLSELNSTKEEAVLEYEVEKTPENIALINRVDVVTTAMVQEFGVGAKPISSKNVILVAPGSVYKITEGKLKGGYHSLFRQNVVIEKGKTNIGFSAKLAHEFFHLKAYHAAQLKQDGTLKPYRSGIKVYGRSGEEVYFQDIQEGVIGEMTDRFYKGPMREMPELKEELEAMGVIKEWMEKLFSASGVSEDKQKILLDSVYSIEGYKKIAAFLLSNEEENYKLGYLAGVLKRAEEKGWLDQASRHDEVGYLNFLIKKIVKKSNGKFKGAEEVFRLFAKAHFTGHLVELAKTIENTLGKGTFRQIAEQSK